MAMLSHKMVPCLKFMLGHEISRDLDLSGAIAFSLLQNDQELLESSIIQNLPSIAAPKKPKKMD